MTSKIVEQMYNVSKADIERQIKYSIKEVKMYAQINQTRQNYVAPRRNTHKPSALASYTMPLEVQAAFRLNNRQAFILENHAVDPGCPPSQVFFFTATPEAQPDGSTIYRVDQ